MGRTGQLAMVSVVLLSGAWGRLARWPSSAPALGCAASALRLALLPGGWSVVRCASPSSLDAPLPAAWARALGQPLRLNDLTSEELAAVPGVGARLARALVAARGARPAGFSRWEEVAAVPGVGPAKLALLRRTTVLRP